MYKELVLWIYQNNKKLSLLCSDEQYRSKWKRAYKAGVGHLSDKQAKVRDK